MDTRQRMKIISGGPNQVIDTVTGPTSHTTTGDDILVPVNVSAEAREIALDDLKELQAKARAFDAFYAGVDNDNDSSTDVDEGTQPVAVTTGSGSCHKFYSIGPDNADVTSDDIIP